MQRHCIYLALGSNLGDRHNNLTIALQQLSRIMDITALSSLYETTPVGYLDQPDFLNMVCSGTTELTPEELLHQAKTIEKELGRQPTFRNGPRPLDIDILLYDDLRLQQEQLSIPHPRMRERGFVLVPLAEIAPEQIDPETGKTIRELLHDLTAGGKPEGVRIYPKRIELKTVKAGYKPQNP